MKKGDLLKENSTNRFATITSNPFIKLFTDVSDWDAINAGYDMRTAADAITVCFHQSGQEKTYKLSYVRRNFTVVVG
tara:strand:- start:20 stop:250 length:231 start_codon:yes stop_codon:yes gene_type:complete